MLADVIILLVCCLGLWLVTRGGIGPSTTSADAAADRTVTHKAEVTLPPAMVIAFFGLVLLALTSWVKVSTTTSLNVTLSSIFFGGEPPIAITTCHQHQRTLMSDPNFRGRAQAGMLDLRCPAGGHIDGTPPKISCSLHGAAEPK